MRFSPTDLFNCAAFAGVAGMILVGGLSAGPQIDPITTASIGTTPASTPVVSDRYMVIDHIGGNTCMIGLSRADGYDVHMVQPGEGCGKISRRLNDARAWQESGRGLVTLTDRTGKPLMRLAPGDGIALEVIEPVQLSVSFEAF